MLFYLSILLLNIEAVNGFYSCCELVWHLPYGPIIFCLLETISVAGTYCYALWRLGWLPDSDDFTCTTPGLLIIDKNFSLFLYKKVI